MVVAGLERHQVGAEQVFRAEGSGPLAEDRLQPDLGDEQPVRGTQALHPVVVRPVEIREFLPAQALHGDDGAALAELPGCDLLHLLLQPDGTEDLHGPLVERGGAGMDRGAGMALDDKMRHPVAGEQDGCGQAYQAAACHKNLSATFSHACSISGRIAPGQPLATARSSGHRPAPAGTARTADTCPFSGRLVMDKPRGVSQLKSRGRAGLAGRQAARLS